MLVALHRARLASTCWSGSRGRAFTRKVPIKVFNSRHARCPPFPSFLTRPTTALLASCSGPAFQKPKKQGENREFHNVKKNVVAKQQVSRQVAKTERCTTEKCP